MSDPFDDLDVITTSVVGDSFTYTTAGGAVLSLKGFVNYAPAVQDFGSAVAAVSDAPTVEILKTDVAVPAKEARITLPRTGLTYRPLDWSHSRCGRLWVVSLSAVA